MTFDPSSGLFSRFLCLPSSASKNSNKREVDEMSNDNSKSESKSQCSKVYCQSSSPKSSKKRETFQAGDDDPPPKLSVCATKEVQSVQLVGWSKNSCYFDPVFEGLFEIWSQHSSAFEKISWPKAMQRILKSFQNRRSSSNEEFLTEKERCHQSICELLELNHGSQGPVSWFAKVLTFLNGNDAQKFSYDARSVCLSCDSRGLGWPGCLYLLDKTSILEIVNDISHSCTTCGGLIWNENPMVRVY